MKQCKQCNNYLDRHMFGVYKLKAQKAIPCENCKTCNNDNINARKRSKYDPLKIQAYYQLNKKQIKTRTNKRHIERRKTDTLYRLADKVRTRVRRALKFKNFDKTSNFAKYIGCSLEELKNHLEVQFQPGMTWNNHTRTGWHIDHIVPLSSAKTTEQLYELCHYTNLQPLWAIDNQKKGSKVS